MHIILLHNKVIKILGKEKYTSHTITCLTVFTHAFCHTQVENLLKGPDSSCKI